MQLSVPELTDFDKEPDQVKALYGIGEKETDSFGRQLLLAEGCRKRGFASFSSAMAEEEMEPGTPTGI